MKKTLLALALSLTFGTKAQITLDHTYFNAPPRGINQVKLTLNGYKYIEFDEEAYTINLYNTNHSLFKAITIPTVSPYPYISYISDNLFDNDSLVEYVIQTFNTDGIYIYKENGTLVFHRDSAMMDYGGTVFYNTEPIIFDGITTKMKLAIPTSTLYRYNVEIYDLPGPMPCVDCSGGSVARTTTGIKKNTLQSESAQFYPNPVFDQLKLKYVLPKEAKLALIKITDLQGKLLEEFKVTGSFDYIYLPSNYNNGMYLYSLIVDGKTVKTEKIILNK